MCAPSTPSTLESRTISLSATLSLLRQSLTRATRRLPSAPEVLPYLSPHMRRDIGLDDGQSAGRRTVADFTGRHGLAP